MNRGKERGITLIVLIITVIILMILAGVSIGLLNDGDIIGKSKDIVDEANSKTMASQEQEAQIYADYDVTGKPIKGSTRVAETRPDDETDDDERIHAGEKASSTTEYTDADNKIAVIPEGFTVSGNSEEKTIDDGLVIYLIDDKTDEEISEINWENSTTLNNLRTTYDQFVWIPIKNTTDANAQDINDMYICQNKGTGSYGTDACVITVENNKAICTAHGNCEQMAGRLYATSLGRNFEAAFTEIYTANSGLREPDVITGNSLGTGTAYDGSYYDARINLNNILVTTNFSNTADIKNYFQVEYNDIVKSVYLNQGFYIGRYETSNIQNNSASYTGPVKTVAGTRDGITSTNWYFMYAEQVDYANKHELNSVGSTMIQGAAYDQVMKFVDTASYKVNPSSLSEYNVNHDFEALYSTGSQVTDCSKNIYDLEGNVTICTTEASAMNYRIMRRGKCRL